jgi:transcriptional regulator with XRE-family HTH domain
MIQKARIDRGYTQEKLAELMDKSLGSIKDYESGKTVPSGKIIKRIADVCHAPHLYAAYINHDEIMSDIIPPIKASQSPEKSAMLFMRSFRDFTPYMDELFNVADGGAVSDEFYNLFSAVVSDGLALRFAKGD